MSKKYFLIVPVALLFSVVAFAGYTLSVPVEIEYVTGGGSAKGNMSTARHSDNEFENIGCGVRVYETGVDDEVMYWGFCQVRLVEDENVICNTYNKELLEGINIISDFSFVTFSWTEDEHGVRTCNYIGSSTQSFYLPLDKDAKKDK